MPAPFAPTKMKPKWTHRSGLDCTTDLVIEQFTLEANGYICEPADPEPSENDSAGWICRGEAHAGMTYSYRYALAYVMRRGV